MENFAGITLKKVVIALILGFLFLGNMMSANDPFLTSTIIGMVGFFSIGLMASIENLRAFSMLVGFALLLIVQSLFWEYPDQGRLFLTVLYLGWIAPTALNIIGSFSEWLNEKETKKPN